MICPRRGVECLTINECVGGGFCRLGPDPSAMALERPFGPREMLDLRETAWLKFQQGLGNLTQVEEDRTERAFKFGWSERDQLRLRKRWVMPTKTTHSDSDGSDLVPIRKDES